MFCDIISKRFEIDCLNEKTRKEVIKMKARIGVGILLFFILLLGTPLFAEEELLVPAVSTEEEVVAEKEISEGVVTGEVISSDAASGTITLKVEGDTEKAFSVVEGETILWKGIEDIELSSIQNGDKAEVGYYTDDSGNLVASWIDVLIEEEEVVPAEEEKTEEGVGPEEGVKQE